MIKGIILVCDQMTSILFDLGFTYSYVSIRFVLVLDLTFDILDAPIYVATLVGESVVVTHVYHSCFELFIGLQTGRFCHFGYVRL